MVTPASIGSAGAGFQQRASHDPSVVSFKSVPDSADGVSPGEVAGLSPIGMGTPTGPDSADAERTPSVFHVETSPGGRGLPVDAGRGIVRGQSAGNPTRASGGTPGSKKKKYKAPAAGVAAAGAGAPPSAGATAKLTGDGPFPVPLMKIAALVFLEPPLGRRLDVLPAIFGDPLFVERLLERVQVLSEDEQVRSDIASGIRSVVAGVCSVAAVARRAG